MALAYMENASMNHNYGSLIFNFIMIMGVVTCPVYAQDTELKDLDQNMFAGGNRDDDALAREEYAYSVGIQAYLYGAPLVRLDKVRTRNSLFYPPSRAKMTTGTGLVNKVVLDGVQFNELIHIRKLSTPQMKLGVTPNNDTMYSPLFFNLLEQPLVISVPKMDRYYSIQLADAFLANFGYIGSRATGLDAGDFLLVGPNWKGTAPEGISLIRSPHNEGMYTLRILVSGPSSDQRIVSALQDQFTVRPLSEFVGETESTIGEDIPFIDFDGEELGFFKHMLYMAKRNPPLMQDAPVWSMLQTVGIYIDQPFTSDSLDPDFRRGLNRAVTAAQKIIAWKVKYRGKQSTTKWNIDFVGGSYGHNYLARAEGATQGLLVHDPEECLYFHTYEDGDGNILDGKEQYVLTFPADSLPPVNAFWSLTGYTPDYNLVENELKRYAIGDRTDGLRYNDDGSLTIFIQSTEPTEWGSSNWLPIPDEGLFRLNLRMYNPDLETITHETVERYIPKIVRREQ